jgi:hypothetical protein
VPEQIFNTESRGAVAQVVVIFDVGVRQLDNDVDIERRSRFPTEGAGE